MSHASTPFRAILHPTDLGAESERALRHAVRLALSAQGSIRLVHARQSTAEPHFPSVADLLAQWGRTGVPGATVAAVEVETVDHPNADAVAAILADAHAHPPDLVVMATHGRDGLTRLLNGSVAEGAARRALAPTLFFSPSAASFVDGDGGLHLRRILVPVDAGTWPSVGAAAAARLALAAGDDPVVFRILHIGDRADQPTMSAQARENWRWERASRDGGVIAGILAEATAWEADAIVMPSAGHDSPEDVLLGSTAERVARSAPCPVLVVPVS